MPTFSVLIKPASSLCNMKCRYCFYCDESSKRSVPSYGIMSETTAKLLIDRAFSEISRGDTVSFAFQGGEPTLAGYDFFDMFTSYVDKTKPDRITIRFSMQTNGLLLDERFCELFKKFNFLIGLSIDGSEKYHDFNRISRDVEPTFRRVLAATKLLQKYGIEFNILTVVTQQIAKHPEQLWNFYKKNNFEYVQFIPCLDPLDSSSHESYSLSPRTYGKFLITLFQIWYREFIAGRYTSVRLFDNLISMAAGYPPELCGMLGFCQPQYVVESDGSVYPCDFYALDDQLCGNIADSSFSDIFASDTMQAILRREEPEGSHCLSCGAYRICGGGCKRYRSFYFSEAGYCPYKEFLYACLPAIKDAGARLPQAGSSR